MSNRQNKTDGSGGALGDVGGRETSEVTEPYCRECGSTKLRYDYECASGHVYQCKQCGNEMQWTLEKLSGV